MSAGDPRNRKIDFDIGKVDYEWVAACTDKKELHKAYAAMMEDGGFPDLERTMKEKLMEIDDVFRRKVLSDKPLSHEQQK